ncbi:unnamed protein product [Staurois parvus]|uniref:Uncharacterized protein n=1 Tax=Staurois parvus TaxID=386267 RepID=A0ABN9BQK8_9NEOB|nr:unnamed protein product [Staurois parvus]CAI9549829.1 unnamed protein product [Staurois parvus]
MCHFQVSSHRLGPTWTAPCHRVLEITGPYAAAGPKLTWAPYYRLNLPLKVCHGSASSVASELCLQCGRTLAMCGLSLSPHSVVRLTFFDIRCWDYGS